MDLSASHIGYVVAAYGLSAILVAGLILYVFARDARLRRELKQVDKSKRWQDQ